MLKNSLPRAISIDCEMVGCGDKGKTSVLGRIAVVSDRMELLMDAFVRPSQRITNFRTKWSGLTWSVLKNGESFEKIRNRFLQIVEHYEKTSSTGLVFVGHDVSNDFDVIKWSPPDSKIRDTSTYVPLRKILVKALLEKGEIDPNQKEGFLRQKSSLKTLSKFILNKNIQQGSHCPREDAKSAMMLYLKVRDKWERSILNNETTSTVNLNEGECSDTKDNDSDHSTSFADITSHEECNLTLTSCKESKLSSLNDTGTAMSSFSEKKTHSRKNAFRRHKKIKKGRKIIK
ncbi:hypothetical protein FG386_001302 [Cryptosporidium ryanae]|uniref:uncharacterized protein n=1 Tax=Cryptosporidium ryanae TaxID=515981 RepID=UPI00351AAEDF|nr:hypothetical protein FG386_001302 [Cryptosporidium ryanae]